MPFFAAAGRACPNNCVFASTVAPKIQRSGGDGLAMIEVIFVRTSFLLMLPV